MRGFQVKSQHGDYRVVVGDNAWKEFRRFPRARYSSTFVLTERLLWKRWRREFIQASGLAPRKEIFVPAGESSKSLQMTERVAAALLDAGADRRSLLIVFGGGVVGDLGGFVASTYMRGIDYLQIPTTVVAQVDSAIGGKTAVDVGAMKNLVGTFYPPRLVLAAPPVLKSLPDRVFRSGFYEVAKHAILSGNSLFARMERESARLNPANSASLDDILARAAKVKVDVVNQDEHEAGLRRVLNLGHTFGHSIEEATGYNRLLHGEAVGWGLLCAARLGVLLGILKTPEAERMARLVRSIGRLPSILDVPTGKILKLLPRDKKAVGGRIHWVVPERIGKVRVIPDVPLALIAAALEGAREEGSS